MQPGLGPRTPDPTSLGIPPNLQEQDDRKFQSTEQVVVETNLQMDTHPGACGTPEHGLQLFLFPPASHWGCLFTTATSLGELRFCSLTQRSSMALSSGRVGPQSPAESAKAIPQPHGRRGQQQGARDKVASRSLLVQVVFLHLLLGRG